MRVQCCFLVAWFAAMVFLLSGCATSHESDMPWNVPQPWEGTLGLPGMTPSDR